jgi:hypothetical protein
MEDCHKKGSAMDCLLLSDPKVEGCRILKNEPDQNWHGPTICMQKNNVWVNLPIELILGPCDDD